MGDQYGEIALMMMIMALSWQSAEADYFPGCLNDLTLCAGLNSMTIINALYINVTEALTLPKRCSVPNIELKTECPALLAPAGALSPASSLHPAFRSSTSSGKKVRILLPVVLSAISVAVISVFITNLIKKKARKRVTENGQNVLQAATNGFSNDHKIGEGGFGAVYKGTLPNGQDIAIKSLSKSSGQGDKEFKNEVLVVAKLQHRNLVRLLGFCFKKEERILVYEFVSNKSLNYFLFDPAKQRQLDWSRRYNIIKGIARGMLYLHEDSRLRIIHRDLKAANVLLDADMNPKISDFGMARISDIGQTEENTNRIVGTYGYMSLEYAMHGQFSVKSDVYSFGVLTLEIVSGRKMSEFYQSRLGKSLLSNAWRHWSKGTYLEFMDKALQNSYSVDEVRKCIHVGLLCVQEDAKKRPTMGTIVHLFNSDSVPSSVAEPQHPAFLFGRTSDQSTRTTNSTSIPLSQNEASITEPAPM